MVSTVERSDYFDQFFSWVFGNNWVKLVNTRYKWAKPGKLGKPNELILSPLDDMASKTLKHTPEAYM